MNISPSAIAAAVAAYKNGDEIDALLILRKTCAITKQESLDLIKDAIAREAVPARPLTADDATSIDEAVQSASTFDELTVHVMHVLHARGELKRELTANVSLEVVTAASSIINSMQFIANADLNPTRVIMSVLATLAACRDKATGAPLPLDTTQAVSDLHDSEALNTSLRDDLLSLL